MTALEPPGKPGKSKKKTGVSRDDLMLKFQEAQNKNPNQKTQQVYPPAGMMRPPINTLGANG